MSIRGTKPVDYFHKLLGKLMWEYAGMSSITEQQLIFLFREAKTGPAIEHP